MNKIIEALNNGKELTLTYSVGTFWYSDNFKKSKDTFFNTYEWTRLDHHGIRKRSIAHINVYTLRFAIKQLRRNANCTERIV